MLLQLKAYSNDFFLLDHGISFFSRLMRIHRWPGKMFGYSKIKSYKWLLQTVDNLSIVMAPTNFSSSTIACYCLLPILFPLSLQRLDDWKFNHLNNFCIKFFFSNINSYLKTRSVIPKLIISIKLVRQIPILSLILL